MKTSTPNREEIGLWVEAWLTRVVKIPAQDVDPDRPFAEYGLGSRAGIRLAGDLEKWLGRRLPPTLAWDHPTVNRLSEHLSQELAEG